MSESPKTKFELRLSGEQRQALQEAADAKGMSLSSFLIEAAMKEREAEMQAAQGVESPVEAEANAFERFHAELQELYASEDEATVRLARQAVSALSNLRFRLEQMKEEDAGL